MKWQCEDVGGAHLPQRQAPFFGNGRWRWRPWTDRFPFATLWPPRVRHSRPRGTSPRQSKRRELADDRRTCKQPRTCLFVFAIFNPVCASHNEEGRQMEGFLSPCCGNLLHVSVCLIASRIKEATLWRSVGGPAVCLEDDQTDLLTV